MPLVQPSQQPLYTGHQPFPRPGVDNLACQQLTVPVVKTPTLCGTGFEPSTRERVAQKEGIGSPGNRDTGERIAHPELLEEGAAQGPQPSPSGEQQSTIDIE